MDIVTLGAALNGSAEYVNSHFKGGSNIQIVDNPDGTQTISASGEVSSEDTVARAEIAEMKDGTNIDSFGDVETALGDKADKDNVYRLALTNADLLPVNTDLDNVKTAGCYYVYDSVNVTTITNRPTNNTSAFRLTVEYAAGEKRARQIYQEFNSFDKYIRWENSSNVFSEWKKVECDLSTKQNTISDLATIRSGAALGATAVQPETGKGLSTNDYTTAEKTKLAGVAEGAEVNVQSNWTQTTTTADDYIKNKPTLGTAAAKNATDTYNATGTDVTTGKAVAAALATLPEPMVFKGSLGTGGTITTLPSASSSNKGYVYKVITAGTYASQSAKVGDTFISDGSVWVLIPSGDEPSGTVTNVAVANGGGLTVSGSPITSSGTITVGHSNSVTAKTSSSLKKFTYDAYGHVTGSSELSTAESNALASGIDSTKVAQIETNKNNIAAVTMGTQSTGDIDLNAVTTNSYKMYTNTTSNLPTSDGSWYFVKTTMFDNNTMLQEATAMNAGAKTYTRIKRGGNWQAWKLSNLDSTQEAVVNSGINDTLVGQITTNKNNISTVQTSLEVGQNDDGKVLTATYSGGTGTYSWVTPSGGGGTSDYTALSNKPQIEGITLTGNKSLSDLGIAPASAVTLVSGLNTTGTVKNGSSVTSATGYTASPIISGIPYYKDTTYESKSAASGGTDVSLCTTGEKYTWNNKSTLQLTNSTTPIVDGTAAIGTSTYAAKADHVHPTDTSRQAAITAQSPLSADVVSDTNTTHKFATQTQLDQISTNANNISTLETMNGAKNFAQLTYTGSTVNGVTYTVSNGIITADGNTTTNAGTNIVITGEMPLPQGEYVLMDGLITSSDLINLTLRINNVWKGTTATGGKYDFTVAQGDTAHIELIVAKNTSTAGVAFKPMIISKTAYDAGFTDFQPYAMTNAEITAWILSHS